MFKVSQVQLYLLRAMYLLIAVGLGLSIWPDILFPTSILIDSHSVIRAILAGFSLMALVGLRYPLQMIPILLLELTWKTIWVITSIPVWLSSGFDEYASSVFFACAMGVVLTPIVIPWKFVFQYYVKAAGEPWRSVAKN